MRSLSSSGKLVAQPELEVSNLGSPQGGSLACNKYILSLSKSHSLQDRDCQAIRYLAGVPHNCLQCVCDFPSLPWKTLLDPLVLPIPINPVPNTPSASPTFPPAKSGISTLPHWAVHLSPLLPPQAPPPTPCVQGSQQPHLDRAGVR